MRFRHLYFLFALKVLHQPLEVDVGHLSEEGQQAGHVLSLPTGKQGGRQVSRSHGGRGSK